MNKIDKKLVEQVIRSGTSDIDMALHALGKEYSDFVVINPMCDPWILDYLDTDYYTDSKCAVWHVDNTWIAKKFTSSWTPSHGWQLIECELEVDTEVVYNPELSFLEFNIDENIPFEDVAYEYVYYLDSKFTPNDDKIWVARVKTVGVDILGEKDAGVVGPVEDSLPKLIFNKDIPRIVYDADFKVPYYDLCYENVWYLNNQFNPFEEKIWVAKQVPADSKGFKDKGYVSPVVIKNPDIPDIEFEITDHIPYFDLCYEHVWMLDSGLHNDSEQIWAAKIVPAGPSAGVKLVSNVKVHTDKFDVIFISYNEPNAEANWQRVLEKAPHAKRVKGVKGIFEAHKQAANLAKTKMFYVVDGDAELDDSWEFNFKVNVFDTDCVHLWTSLNPINGLEYGYGGVKLFPRQLLLDAETWNVDLTTGLGKLKLVNRVSNITAFNYDEFTTWRSAFRECAKLSSSLMASGNKDQESEHRLEIWTTVGHDRPMGEFAIAGALLGKKYGSDNYNNIDQLKLINDYEWLKDQFNRSFGKK